MSREHRLDASRIHHDWDRSREPALVISPGDVVHFELPMAGERQVFETSTVDEVVWDFETIYNLGGPIFVEGASPGDTLEVEILELEPGPWGWATIIPGLGLLPDDFADPYLKIFDLRDRHGRDARPGRRGSAPAVSRHDGRAHRRARPLRALPAAQGRRQRRLPPLDRRLDALAAGLVRGRALLVRGSARGTGRRRGLRDRDRVRDERDAPLPPQRSGDRRSRVPRAADRWKPEGRTTGRWGSIPT